MTTIESGDLVQVMEIGEDDTFSCWVNMRYRYFVVPGDHKIKISDENKFMAWHLITPHVARRKNSGTVTTWDEAGLSSVCFYRAKVRLIKKHYV